VRFLAGAASAEPAASARSGTPAFSNAGDLDPGNCSAFVVGSAPNAGVTSERGSDAEIAYGHQFASASVGITAYVTSVRDQIFDATEALADVAGLTAASPELASFYDRIRSVCPGEFAAASDARIFNALTVSEAINAARALGRGVELRGEVRLGRALTVNATYAIDSMRRFDLPVSVLVVPSNATIVDGGQVAGIPVHQASLTIAHANARGLSGDVAAYYEGPNNHLNLPGYAFANLALHAPLGRTLRLDVAVDNVFDSHADTYGRVGLGLFQPENPFGPDTNALEQATERYGLSPTTIRLTISFPRTIR
jgi:outer membrane cobalamin receptor